MKNQNNERQS